MGTTPEQLQDLNGRYRLNRYLGQGANDIAYLIKDRKNNPAVALTPKDSLWGWNKLRGKYAKVAQLDALGLNEHLVHPLDQGILNLGDKGSEVLVVEYGGEPLDKLSGEKAKLQAAQQILSIMQTLHNNGLAINDFKHDHWVFQRMGHGTVLVKLIDYTQIANVSAESMRLDQNDHRKSDLHSYRGILEDLFPWFNSQVPNYGLPYKPLIERTTEDLHRLEAEMNTLSLRDKLIRRLINRIRI